MKNKITFRLIGYFSAVLLLFSVIVGILFCMLFTWHTSEIHKEELKNRAVSIAGTLSKFPQKEHRGQGMSGGYGAYLKFIDDIAMSEVWIVDENARTIQMGHRRNSLSYSELPLGAEDLIKRVFEGNVVSNQEFNSVLDIPSITIGAPIYNTKGNITAVILLHSPVNGISNAQRDGIIILVICIIIALFLAIVLSILLARRFINPLKKMEQTTEKIIQGNYLAHTNITQNDEIGTLALNIDKLSIQLLNAEKERKNLDKMRQDFVSNISHELRTPVTVIRGSLEVLAEGLISEPNEMQEYFNQMLSDTTHLQRLINDLLELSRLQNTDFQIEKTELNLDDILKEAIRSIKRMSEKKQVKIEYENKTENFYYIGDYGRLRQMFMIILDNAVKFSPPNNKVSVKMYYKEDNCIVSISDCGRGILPKDIPYIFDRFYKERSEQNKSGSGLGLSIAKQIAERHNIIIKCESKPNYYTTFSFIFQIINNKFT